MTRTAAFLAGWCAIAAGAAAAFFVPVEHPAERPLTCVVTLTWDPIAPEAVSLLDTTSPFALARCRPTRALATASVTVTLIRNGADAP